MSRHAKPPVKTDRHRLVAFSLVLLSACLSISVWSVGPALRAELAFAAIVAGVVALTLLRQGGRR